MKHFLLLTLILTMVAPTLVQAAVAAGNVGVKAAISYHDHSSHNKQGHDDSDSGDIYVFPSATSLSAPNYNIEKISFSSLLVLAPVSSLVMASHEIRAPPDWSWPESSGFSTGQPSLIFTTQRFRI